MKHGTRLLAAALSLVLCLGCLSVPAAAADQEEMLQVLALLSVMNGDGQGELHLDRTATRAEFVKMCVSASVYQDRGDSPTGLTIFSDVPAGHWAAGYLAAASGAGWLKGDLDGRFRPDEGITLAEAADIALRMLGYTDADFTAQWPASQMELCRSLELDEHISASSGQTLTRLECGWLIYNLLSAPARDGTVYCAGLGYALDADGEIDALALMDSELSGPLVAEEHWTAQLGFTPRKVYRDNQESSPAEVAAWDVLYYQKETATVFAYSTRHTGTITAIGPGADQPQSVTVGGVTYELGSAQAARSLSSQGQFAVGDVVTLLMGRNSQVAAVLSGQALDHTVYGVVAAKGQTAYANAAGETAYLDYVDVIATDGDTYRFETEDDALDTGALVSVRYSGEGRAVRQVGGASIAGAVTGSALGGTAFAPDVEILDVWENAAVPVPVSRLQGCRLESGDVRFVAYDAAGRIQRLILDDFTGDVHRYGLLTESATTPTGEISFVSQYTCLIAGEKTQLSSSGTAYPVTAGGGVELQYKDGAVHRIYELDSVRAEETGETWISASGQRYTLSDQVQVYVRRNGDYYLSAWSQVRDSGMKLTAWYDAADSQGGRVRVIVAQA